MKTIFKPMAWVLLIMMFPALATAQEILTGFNHQATPPDKSRDAAALTLPFYDDFTDSGIFPDAARWSDFNVYVNSGFPRNPVTRNAATFDVLDHQGHVYEYAMSAPFIAEFLTSNVIRLDSVFDPEPQALTPNDSIYFSFFYQPQGNGNAPETPDSLVLEFGVVTEIDTLWHHVWSVPGMPLAEFVANNGGNYFKQVMIPITDTAYFKSKFCFRFFNYASIANNSLASQRGNDDAWNIDVVYLNRGRTILDPSYPKVCITGERPSFLSKYTAMPYTHYRANATAHIAERYPLYLSNLDNNNHPLKHRYTVDQVNGGQHYAYTTHGTFDLSPMTYCRPDTAMVAQLFSMDLDRDSTSYIIRHYVSDSTCTPPLVDSLVYRQGFYNYFAYDDGIPELGFGVNPSTPGGCFAVKFELSKVDYIYGVQLLFNRTLNDANNQYFDIVIWKESNGKPGNEVYRSTDRRPMWSEDIYGFVYYKFDQPVRLNGVFYVGLAQHGTGMLNIGFDSSRDCSKYNFFDNQGTWQQSLFPGAIMIRPVAGTDSYIGIDESDDTEITVYPIPASSTLHIEGVTDGVSITLYDLTGRQVMQRPFTNELPVGHLQGGLYFLGITTANGNVICRKIIVKP